MMIPYEKDRYLGLYIVAPVKITHLNFVCIACHDSLPKSFLPGTNPLHQGGEWHKQTNYPSKTM